MNAPILFTLSAFVANSGFLGQLAKVAWVCAASLGVRAELEDRR